MKKYYELKALGFQFTGKIFKSWENKEANAYAKSLRTNGTQAYAVRETEVTRFRDHTDRNTYFKIMILLSPEAKALKDQAWAAEQLRHRQAELRAIAAPLTLEEIAFLLTCKTQEA